MQVSKFGAGKASPSTSPAPQFGGVVALVVMVFVMLVIVVVIVVVMMVMVLVMVVVALRYVGCAGVGFVDAQPTHGE